MDTNDEDAEAQPRQRRDKYISKACQACRRRKIKCSGHNTCFNCLERGMDCVYESDGRKKGQKTAKRQRIDYPPRHTTTQARPPTATSPRSFHRKTPSLPLDIHFSPSIRNPSLPPAHISPATSRLGSDINLLQSKDCLSITLPSAADLARLVNIFFANVHPEYPILDQADITSRLASTLRVLEHQVDGDLRRINVDSAASPILALMCSIVSLALVSSSGSHHNAPSPRQSRFSHPPGFEYYTRSKQLLHTFEPAHASPDIISCYVLHCIYALQVDNLQASLHSHAAAARSLATIDPYYQDSDCTDRLWWTIWILDRELSRMLGISCMLRAEQLPKGLRDRMDNHLIGLGCGRSSTSSDSHNNSPELLSPRLNGKMKDTVFLEARGYLSETYNRICGHNRPSSAHKECRIRSSAICDAELDIFEALLPQSLRLESGVPMRESNGVASWDTLLHPLIILLTVSKIRLNLRKASIQCDCFSQLKSDGPEVARKVIEATSQFLDSIPKGNPVPSITTIATALGECASYLITLIDDDESTEEHSEANGVSDSVEQIYDILIGMPETCAAVKKALDALEVAINTPETQASSQQPQVSPSGQGILPAAVNRDRFQAGAREKHDITPNNSHSRFEALDGYHLLDELQSGYQSLDHLAPS